MLPLFPSFKKISIDDQKQIENLTSPHPPYSDFNFLSLYSWESEETLVSVLNNNLIIKLSDYLTNEQFYTFIGTSNIVATIQMLLEHASKEKVVPYLKLIPETTLKSNLSTFKYFYIKEDRDNFDYIYSISENIYLPGHKFGVKRNFVNRFKKKYNSKARTLNLRITKNKLLANQIFHIWKMHSNKDATEIQNEQKAFSRLIQSPLVSQVKTIGVFIDNNLVGFSVNEVLTHGYAMNLFEKADIRYEGVFSYLRNITCKYLSNLGCQFLNHEQDLGIPGLRKSKLSYNPQFFLKKYSVYLK